MNSIYDLLEPNSINPNSFGLPSSSNPSETAKLLDLANTFLRPQIHSKGKDLSSPASVRSGTIDLSKPLEPNQKINPDGYIIGKDAPIGIPRVWSGLGDALFGAVNIKRDEDQRGTRNKGEVSVAGFGGKAPDDLLTQKKSSENVGSSTPSLSDQINALFYEVASAEARRPLFLRALADIKKHNVDIFQSQMGAQAPWLQWAASQAPAQQSRLYGDEKGNYLAALGMAALATAAKPNVPRAFGRQGVRNWTV